MIQNMFSDLNWLAVLAGGAVYYIIGAAWYGLMGKGWMEAAGLKMEEIQQNFNKAAYGMTLVLELIIAACMAGLMSIIGPENGLSFPDALQFGLVVGLVFSGLTTYIHYIYSMRKKQLILYDAGYTTIASIAACGVMQLIGV